MNYLDNNRKLECYFPSYFAEKIEGKTIEIFDLILIGKQIGINIFEVPKLGCWDHSLIFNSIVYKIRRFHDHIHRKGNGGEYQTCLSIEKDENDRGGRQLLISREFCCWSTTSDDYIDTKSPIIKNIYLVEEEDVARKFFEGIKKYFLESNL